jgi:eukaryotic-like serine/threonine-protein kinase
MSLTSWIGRKLSGRYEILELLGQGGMSAVYKAQDHNLKRVVAIKLIHAHLSIDPEFVRRFEQEAAAVAQLRHPNLIQVFDFNHDADTYYIVFEFVPGETLQERLKRMGQAGRRMEVKEVVDIIAKTADGLHYAHNKEIIHRDIKPANIMLNIYGEPIVTDFGIAKIMGGTQHTATGATLGTARYMAPEQIKGERIDPRTDLYALGIVLYEMLSGGQPPFEADSAMALMMKHITDPVPNLGELRPDLPPRLVTVVNKTLAKDKQARFASGAEMAAALRRLDKEPAAAVPAAADATVIETPIIDPEKTVVESMAAPAAAAARKPAAQPTPVTVHQAPATQPAAPPGGGGVPPAAPPAAAGGMSRNPVLLGAGALLVLLLAIGVWAIFLRPGGDPESDAAAVAAAMTAEAEATAVAILEAATETPTHTATPEPTNTVPPSPTATSTRAATATATSEPTSDPYAASPTPTAVPPTWTPAPPTPTEAPPAPQYSVRINSIRLENGRYIVEYGTTGYTEQLPGQHIHFYWNNISQERAGVGPNQASWFVYGGPRPFTGWGVNDRPAGVTAMCAIFANPDHTVVLNTGNCVNLPEG